MATPVNTLAVAGGYVPDGAAHSAEANGGTLEANESKGAAAHRAAPHLAPAAK